MGDEVEEPGMFISHTAKVRGRRIRQRIWFPRSGWAMRRCETRRYLLPKSSGLWKSTKVI
jgi:hypothetical protein